MSGANHQPYKPHPIFDANIPLIDASDDEELIVPEYVTTVKADAYGNSNYPGYPPYGGEYPPQGGMYPPPAGYPPQDGMYPPADGMYPPAGGMYPPPGGYPGGYPPADGGYYPPSGPPGGWDAPGEDMPELSPEPAPADIPMEDISEPVMLMEPSEVPDMILAHHMPQDISQLQVQDEDNGCDCGGCKGVICAIFSAVCHVGFVVCAVLLAMQLYAKSGSRGGGMSHDPQYDNYNIDRDNRHSRNVLDTIDNKYHRPDSIPRGARVERTDFEEDKPVRSRSRASLWQLSDSAVLHDSNSAMVAKQRRHSSKSNRQRRQEWMGWNPNNNSETNDADDAAGDDDYDEDFGDILPAPDLLPAELFPSTKPPGGPPVGPPDDSRPSWAGWSEGGAGPATQKPWGGWSDGASGPATQKPWAGWSDNESDKKPWTGWADAGSNVPTRKPDRGGKPESDRDNKPRPEDSGSWSGWASRPGWAGWSSSGGDPAWTGWSEDTHDEKVPTKQDTDPAMIAAIILAVCYVGILVEAGFSRTFQYLGNFVSIPQLGDYMDGVRRRKPEIKFSIECFHYETRREEYTATENGRRVTRMRTRQIRVVTHRDEERFTFNRLVDASGNIRGFIAGAITRLEVNWTLGFIDAETECAYDKQKEDFLDRNRGRDEQHAFSEQDELDGYEQYMSVYDSESAVRCCMKRPFFCFYTMIFMTWLYRFWFTHNSVKKKYTLVKLVGK